MKVSEALRELWRSLLSDEDNECDDLEDRVPDDIGVTGPALSHGEFGDKFWYITATYGTGNDHQHIEIKLDWDRLVQLWGEIMHVVNVERNR